MSNPRVATRYAKSLLDLAVERDQLEAVHSDMLYLQQLTKESRDFLIFLRSPVVKPDTKARAITAITKGKIGDLTAAFLNLMISKTRESVLPEIITAFINQYKDRKGIRTVKLTTATPVSEDVKTAILGKVKESEGIDTLELEEVIDPAIIGGFVLQTGDKLIDASVSYDLRNIARQFENNDFIYKVR